MDIKQKYREETNKDIYRLPHEKINMFTTDYVKWLEQQLSIQLVSGNEVKLKFNEFASKQQDLDSEFVKIVNDNFWDLL